jgi:hypothetical protein
MTRRASKRVTLVLAGAAALQGCGLAPDSTPRAQDTYLSLEECQADWGRPEHCERQEIRTGAGPSTYFRGPAYYEPDRERAQRQAHEAARRAGVAVPDERPGNRSVGRVAAAPSARTFGTARRGFGATARTFSIGT